MSLSQYTEYTAARTELNNRTDIVSTALLSSSTDPIAVCVTDARKMNVWFIEVINSSVNNNTVTVKGPGIHLGFDSPFIDANQWVQLLNTWADATSTGLANAMISLSLSVGFVTLSKCEICGSFNSNRGSSVFTLKGVLKNNTLNTTDDNIIVAIEPGQAAKVGALVTFLTTRNRVVELISNDISFLNGTTSNGILGTIQISNIS